MIFVTIELAFLFNILLRSGITVLHFLPRILF